MSYEAAVKLSEISGVAMPTPVEVRPDYVMNNDGKKRVYLHRSGEVHRYFNEIGASNPKHLSRYKQFVRTVLLRKPR
jgi:hypothetical protein